MATQQGTDIHSKAPDVAPPPTSNSPAAAPGGVPAGLYGNRPPKNPVYHALKKDRFYFDSGDYNMERAGIKDPTANAASASQLRPPFFRPSLSGKSGANASNGSSNPLATSTKQTDAAALAGNKSNCSSDDVNSLSSASSDPSVSSKDINSSSSNQQKPSPLAASTSATSVTTNDNIENTANNDSAESGNNNTTAAAAAAAAAAPVTMPMATPSYPATVPSASPGSIVVCPCTSTSNHHSKLAYAMDIDTDTSPSTPAEPSDEDDSSKQQSDAAVISTTNSSENNDAASEVADDAASITTSNDNSSGVNNNADGAAQPHHTPVIPLDRKLPMHMYGKGKPKTPVQHALQIQRKYFDSGDYNMAKAGGEKPTPAPSQLRHPFFRAPQQPGSPPRTTSVASDNAIAASAIPSTHASSAQGTIGLTLRNSISSSSGSTETQHSKLAHTETMDTEPFPAPATDAK